MRNEKFGDTSLKIYYSVLCLLSLFNKVVPFVHEAEMALKTLLYETSVRLIDASPDETYLKLKNDVLFLIYSHAKFVLFLLQTIHLSLFRPS